MKISSLLCAAVTFSASAQCTPQWIESTGLAGVNNNVYAMTRWDPDGTGPQQPLLVIGGNKFTVAGNKPIDNRIVLWNPDTQAFSTLPSDMDNTVRALAVLPDGQLVAAGSFRFTGGVQSQHIAKWNGTTWMPIGPGFNGDVYSLLVLQNGDLIASGHFSGMLPVVGGLGASRIARWNGNAWSALGTGITGAANLTEVFSLAELPGGDIVAAGRFTTAGGIPAANIARWTGQSWSALGDGLTGDTYAAVRALAVRPSGELIAGGTFQNSGPDHMQFVATWDGTAWTNLGEELLVTSGGTSVVTALQLLPDASLIVSGEFGLANETTSNIARFDGNHWSTMGEDSHLWGEGTSLVLLPEGGLVANASCAHGDQIVSTLISRWNGTQWSALCGGTPATASIESLVLRPNGELIGAGDISLSTIVRTAVARRDGESWREIPSAPSWDISARTVAIDSQGGILLGSDFMLPEHWDGLSWSLMLAGLETREWGSVRTNAFTTLQNGDIIACGEFSVDAGIFGIMRWNGTRWSNIGPASTHNPSLSAAAVLHNGNLVAAGDFGYTGLNSAQIARWDGATWTTLASGNQSVRALRVLQNGDLLAAGNFSTLNNVSRNNIARWNGSSWSSLGSGLNGQVECIVERLNGDIIAGGLFTTAGGLPAVHIASWSGNSWSPLGAGLSNASNSSAVLSLAFFPNGDLAAAGTFTASGDQVFYGFARYSFGALCAADFNCDQSLDLFDYLNFVESFAANDPAADFNHDSIIDLFDYLDFVDAHSSGC